MGSFAEPTGSPRGRIQVADPVPSLGPNIRITPQARYYAVSELCRRAGITREFFRTWKVSVASDRTIFEISNGTQKFITFPHANASILKTLGSGHFSCVKLALTETIAREDGSRLSHCVVPFVASEIEEGASGCFTLPIAIISNARSIFPCLFCLLFHGGKRGWTP